MFNELSLGLLRERGGGDNGGKREGQVKGAGLHSRSFMRSRSKIGDRREGS